MRHCDLYHLISKKLTHLGELFRWLAWQETATATSSDRELAVDERYTSPQSTPKPITPANTFNMPVKPITGMLRRGLVLDLSVAFGTSPPFRPASDPGNRLERRKEEPLGVAIWL
jgi:hypothetical protein